MMPVPDQRMTGPAMKNRQGEHLDPAQHFLGELEQVPETLSPTEDQSQAALVPNVHHQVEPWSPMLLELLRNQEDDPLQILVKARRNRLANSEVSQPGSFIAGHRIKQKYQCVLKQDNLITMLPI